MSATLSSPSLKKLLEDARALIQERGSKNVTQRGQTYSLNTVMLTWERPEEDTDSYWYWDEASDAWYQKVFVEKRAENDPTALPESAHDLYAYTYAHRARFADGGWGHVVAVLRTLTRAGYEEIPGEGEKFVSMLHIVSRSVHAKIALAVFLWLGRERLNTLLRDTERAEDMLARTRMDALACAIEEIAAYPASRRAVTPSFLYPSIDFASRPVLSLPPYQFFQFLPAESADAPLSSSHIHRSLDVAGGAQLDFHHDLAWLREASVITGRPVGDITIVAQNLHLYTEGENSHADLIARTTIQQWLNAVVDGYRAETDDADAFLEKDVYKQNVARMSEAWHH